MMDSNASGAVAVALVGALLSGHCSHLEELNLYSSFEDEESVRFVLQSVKNLCLPGLRRFEWGNLKVNQDYSILLGEALKAGAFPKLENLRFFEQSVHHSLWEALEAGSCPEVKDLGLEKVLLDSGSSTALASAIASGALRKLQHLYFHNSVDGYEGTSLAEVLTAVASSCPDLRHLGLCGGFRNPATR